MFSIAAASWGASYSFSTGSPNGLMATASRPSAGPAIEIETADDFILPSTTVINQATFTGLLPSGASLTSVSEVVVEIYRVFPLDSANPSGRVPTRTNSPSDAGFDSRDSSAGGVAFTVTLLNANFSAVNSVINGINPFPNQTTGGEGPVSGEEVSVSVTFTPPFALLPGHYFFVPQVALSSGNFFWLSAARPAFTGDLQDWIRNANLAPDWLRIGTDIVGGTTPPTFNGTFSLTGFTPPRGDFNRDGMSDIFWRNGSTGNNSMWLMSGPAVALGASLPLVADPSFRVVGISDFQGDGKADVLWRNATTGANVLWLMDGINVAVGALLPTVPDPNWTVAGVGDFDGNGKADILWRNIATGDNAVWFMDGINVASSASLPSVTDTNFKIAGVGDFQGDGKDDILWRNAVTGANVVWLMNGSSVAVSALLPFVADPNWIVAGVGDFQGDGKADVLWRNIGTGDNELWLMDGISVAVSAALPSVPDTNWTVARVADFQGDGKADIFWRNRVTGDNAIWLMNGPAVAVAAALPAVADPNWQVGGPP